MTNNNVIDVPSEHAEQPQQALAVRDPQQAIQALDRMTESKPGITAAQAKIEAVANLTASAYSKASELRLTPEETAALQADFPDEAFKSGAAGKENLIYIEHAYLRDRLNSVFGCGQWSIVQRSRWAEDFSYFSKGQHVSGTRIYVECMLLIRGCYVAENIGDMDYYPKNHQTNYGDAVRGATTQALRRCCADLGIGLQAWKKDWCNGWWDRRNGNRDAAAAQRQQQPIQHPRNTPAPAQAPAAPAKAPAPAPRPPEQQGGEMVYPVVKIDMVAEKTGSTNGKPWKVYFLKVNDGMGEFDCGTFDEKIAVVARELYDSGANGRLVAKPGRKPGSKEVVSLERASDMPSAPPDDQVPMDFDNAGNPMDVIP
jgi:hypothetical protein